MYMASDEWTYRRVGDNGGVTDVWLMWGPLNGGHEIWAANPCPMTNISVSFECSFLQAKPQIKQ